MKRLILPLASLLVLHAIPVRAGDAPSVLVKTEMPQQQQLDVTLAGYGVVEAPPAGTANVSLPRAGRLVALRVSTGEIVTRGQALFEMQTDPVAGLDYSRAVHGLDVARAERQRIEALAQARLATHAQVAAAEQAYADAQAALAAQRRLGMDGGRSMFTAPFAGVVQSLGAAPGDRLAAGTTVLQLARTGVLRVRLGIEPEDAARVKPGAAVRIVSVFDPQQAVAARVRRVQGMIDPRTQLVDVLVTLHPTADDPLLPGARVRGDITVASVTGWAVPRQAVLADDRGEYVFQVSGAHAVRVPVVTQAKSGARVAVNGNLDPSLPLVVLGNYELKNGMAVRESGP
jgi:RND family efflux transporter MFP subunit